jgi:chromosomal replication initiator protein
VRHAETRDWLLLTDKAVVITCSRRDGVTMADVLKAVCDVTNVTPELMIGPRRNQGIARVRHLAMYLVRESCPHASFPMMGRLFRRDHTSIIHGCKRAERRLREDPDYAMLCYAVRARMEQYHHGEMDAA